MGMRLTVVLIALLMLQPVSGWAMSAAESFDKACYDDVGFVRDVSKQQATCQCVGLHMQLYIPKRMLNRELDDLKKKHLLRVQKAASKSLIQCMDHFIGDLFTDICERAEFEHDIDMDCECVAQMGQLSLESHRPGWLDEISRAKEQVNPQAIIGSDAVKADIAASMQVCQ